MKGFIEVSVDNQVSLVNVQHIVGVVDIGHNKTAIYLDHTMMTMIVEQSYAQVKALVELATR